MVTQLPETDKIKLAVVTGGHPFDVPGFRNLFDAMPDVDPYIQDVDNWAVSQVRDQYDAFLFFNMHAWGIHSVRKDMDDRIIAAIKQLGETDAGVFVMHHATVAWPWVPEFDDVCNMEGRDFSSEGHSYSRWALIDHEIVDPEHPITKGMSPFTLNTEGFLIGEPREGSVPLLTTTHPESSKTVGWTHQLKNARVFCYMIGHDADDWYEENYNQILHRGIQWVANRI